MNRYLMMTICNPGFELLERWDTDLVRLGIPAMIQSVFF
jgi:hypothetical protein